MPVTRQQRLGIDSDEGRQNSGRVKKEKRKKMAAALYNNLTSSSPISPIRSPERMRVNAADGITLFSPDLHQNPHSPESRLRFFGGGGLTRCPSSLVAVHVAVSLPYVYRLHITLCIQTTWRLRFNEYTPHSCQVALKSLWIRRIKPDLMNWMFLSAHYE